MAYLIYLSDWCGLSNIWNIPLPPQWLQKGKEVIALFYTEQGVRSSKLTLKPKTSILNIRILFFFFTTRAVKSLLEEVEVSPVWENFKKNLW